MFKNQKGVRPLGVPIIVFFLTFALVISFFDILKHLRLSDSSLYPVIEFCLAIVELFIVIGLWRLKKWGLFLAEGLFSLAVLVCIYLGYDYFYPSTPREYGPLSFFFPITLVVVIAFFSIPIFYLYKKRIHFY